MRFAGRRSRGVVVDVPTIGPLGFSTDWPLEHYEVVRGC
jgi:hypothetical protein